MLRRIAAAGRIVEQREKMAWCNERDALLADNERLRNVLQTFAALNFKRAIEVLAATPAQSLARIRNQVREECIEVARLHGTNRTVEEIRAMKEQP